MVAAVTAASARRRSRQEVTKIMSYRIPTTPRPTVEILPGDALRLGDVTLTFQRTLRIPDDGKRYPLPPGLGRFPIRFVDAYGDRVPAEMREKGGVMIPMHSREAMWLQFSGPERALKVGVGKVSAITGEKWEPGLSSAPQGYVVTGVQPWLDGIATGKGTIRQFVAMPLGMGYTVEGQITGEEKHGGLQLEVFGPKPGRLVERRRFELEACAAPAPCAMKGPPMPASPLARSRAGVAMGVAAGGRMEQKIYPDPHGIDTWDQTQSARCFVHIVSAQTWREITGEEPPATPITAKTYAKHGYPWFALYDEHLPALEGSDRLAAVKSVAEKDAHVFGAPLSDEGSVAGWPVKMLKKLGLVRDGDW